MNRYLAALTLSLSVLLICWAAHYRHNLSINIVASVLATVYGGIGPGLLAAFTSAAGIEAFLRAPGATHNYNFIFTAILVNIVVFCLRSSYRKADTAMHEAERLNQQMDNIIAIISHDLKTPLTSITLKADMLLRDQTEQRIEDLKKTTNAMARMIDHLLDFENIKTGRLLTSQLKTENINALLTEVIGVMEPVAALKSIELRSSTEADFIPVKCDRVRISQVFSNLIENGIKYSAANGSIFIETSVIGDTIRCLISDSGEGIEPEHLPHVFDKFWQAKHTAHQGLGLGLSIVKEILEAHNGGITVRSQIGVGTTFVFTLPLARELPEAFGVTRGPARPVSQDF